MREVLLLCVSPVPSRVVALSSCSGAEVIASCSSDFAADTAPCAGASERRGRAPVVVSCSDSEDDLDLAALAARSVQQSVLSGVLPEPLGLSSSQVKDVLILQLPLIIGRVLGQVLVWDSMQQHAWSAGLARAVLDKLVELSSRFKYIVHVVLVENKGSVQLMNGCYSKAAAVDHFRHRWHTSALHGGVDVFCSWTLPRQ